MSIQKNIIRGLFFSATVLSLAACSTSNQETTDTNQATEQSSKQSESYISNATFVLGKDGVAVKETDVPKTATVIDWYIDPSCPHCAELEDLMKDEIKKMTADGTTFIRYHVITFLSAQTEDDYSNRAAGFILSAIETTPDKAYDYLTAIVSESFEPAKGKTSDDKFKEAYIKIGGTEENWKTIKNNQESYIKQAKKATTKNFNDKNLISKTEEGALYVPLIIIGDSEKALNFNGEVDTVEYIKQSLTDYKEKHKTTESSSTTETSTSSSTKQ